MNAYNRDNQPKYRKDVDSLKISILLYMLKKGKATMDNIYTDLKCEDITMYVAIHELIKENRISGESLYESDKQDHRDFIYKVKL